MSSELLIRSCVPLSWQCVVNISGMYITEAPSYAFMAFTGTTLLFFVIFVLCLRTGGMVAVAF